MDVSDDCPGPSEGGLDHLVVAVPVLEDGVLALERLTGVRATLGGRHPMWGTHNALVLLGSPDDRRYLEIIAPDPSQATPSVPRPFGLDNLWPVAASLRDSACDMKLVNWALKAPGIARRVERARSAGYDPGEATLMERSRPDGSRLRWQLTRAPYESSQDGVIPFLIDWGESAHPSSQLPPGLELKSFYGESPEPEKATSILRSLAAALPVRHSPRRGLVAVLTGPGGSVELA